MTVPINTPSKTTLAGNTDAATKYTTTYTVFDATHIDVYKNGVKVESGITITIAAHATHGKVAECVFSSGQTASDVILLIRNVPYNQEQDFINNSVFDIESLERGLDQLTMQTQQLDTKTDGTIKFADSLSGATAFDSTAETAGTITANKAARLGKALIFHSTTGDLSLSATSFTGLEADISALAAIEADIATLADIEDGTDATDAIQTAVTNAAAIIAAPVQAGLASDSADEAEEWATKVNGYVSGSGNAAKAWAIGGLYVDDTALRGSAKAWATNDEDATVDETLFSAKHHSIKAAAQVGLAETQVGLATDQKTLATNQALAAANSAAAVASVFDNFDDTYLGSMPDRAFTTATFAADDFILSSGHGLIDGDIIRVTSQTTLPTNLSVDLNYYVRDKTATTFKLAPGSVSGTPINTASAGTGIHTWGYGIIAVASTVLTAGSSVIPISDTQGILVGMAVSGTGIQGTPVPNVISILTDTSVRISEPVVTSGTETVTFTAAGVTAPLNFTKDGPALDNDGAALSAGALYFNSTDTEMRIYDGGNWLAASAAGTASLKEYKFVTTAAQVISKSYSGVADVGGSLSYTVNNVLVFLNGVLLKDTTDYVASTASSIVLITAPVLSDELTVIAFNSFSVSTVEGTSILSTGEAASTKFLRQNAGAGVGASWVEIDTSAASQSASTNLTGAIADQYFLSLAYILTGDVTIAGDNVFGKIVNGTTDISLTNDSSDRIISGPETAGVDATITFNGVMFN
jgi:hypothetical protein